jgi:hypothetical protein
MEQIVDVPMMHPNEWLQSNVSGETEMVGEFDIEQVPIETVTIRDGKLYFNLKSMLTGQLYPISYEGRDFFVRKTKSGSVEMYRVKR